MSFWGELKRRDVFKVAVAYLVASWLIVQVVGVLTEPLNLPDVLDTIVVVLLAIGFPFVLIVTWVYDVTPDGIRVTPATDGTLQVPSRPGKRLTYVVIALLLMAVGLMAIDNYLLMPSSSEFGAGSRLAVLPCDDLSPDPTNSFFAVGIHEELLNRLAPLSALEVISRTSVQQYESRRPPIPQIAAELDVDTVMECGARYAGDRVLLTVQLIDGKTDAHLWSQSYPADMADLRSVFEIQADLAMDVANALQIAFLDDEREQIERLPTQSREAYERYLASFEAWPNFGNALALVEQALTLDDQFVEAWIRKAGIHNVIAGFRAGQEAAAAERAAAIDASERAVALAPESGAAHAQLAFSLGQSGDWIGSENEARRAEDLGAAPFNPFVKMSVGYFAEAAALLEDNLRTNPMNSLGAATLLRVYKVLGDEQAYRRHWERGESLYVTGWLGPGVEAGQRLADKDLEFLQTNPVDGNPIWDAGIANLDSPADGIAAMRSLYANPRMRSAIALQSLSAWAHYFGDLPLAVQWFGEAVSLQNTVLSIAWIPSYADMRREPAFKDLLIDQRLPEFWRRFGWPEFCRPIGNDDFECD